MLSVGLVNQKYFKEFSFKTGDKSLIGLSRIFKSFRFLRFDTGEISLTWLFSISNWVKFIKFDTGEIWANWAEIPKRIAGRFLSKPGSRILPWDYFLFLPFLMGMEGWL